MSDVVNEFSLSIRQVQEFEFLVKFDKPYPDLRTDEPPPLGKDTAPSPSRIMAAAIGNCLSASLLFACRKAGVAITNLQADVQVKVVRTEKKRLRIGGVQVTIDPGLSAADAEKAKGARQVFEDFCTVTQSVRDGIPVEVKVKGIDG